jgi:hypothetical protein
MKMVSKRKSKLMDETGAGVILQCGQATERLQARVKQLEKELSETRKVLAGVQAERDLYLRSLHSQVWKQFSKEELHRFTQEEDEGKCESLDQFIGELENTVRRAKRA